MSENKNGEKEARTVIGNARVIHDALPNATFIGFTGTRSLQRIEIPEKFLAIILMSMI